MGCTSLWSTALLEVVVSMEVNAESVMAHLAKNHIKAGERRWLPQNDIFDEGSNPSLTPRNKHINVDAGAAALLELDLFYWKNGRSTFSNEEVCRCGSAIFYFYTFKE
jgi:hypothetical protein